MFDGDTYEPEHDEERLTSLLIRVRRLMSDGEWRTLAQIAKITGGTEASVSARLRDLRKTKFGAFNVVRQRVQGQRGLFTYSIQEPRTTRELMRA